MPTQEIPGPRQENLVEAWSDDHDQPFNPYFSSRQSCQLPPSNLQWNFETWNGQDLDSLPRTYPTMFSQQIDQSQNVNTRTPSSCASSLKSHLRQNLATSSRQRSFTKYTTTTSRPLTLATEPSTNMSRQNRVCEDLNLGDLQMLKIDSCAFPFSDSNATGHYIPWSTRPNYDSHNYVQSQLLMGTGGASHTSYHHDPAFGSADDFQSAETVLDERFQNADSGKGATFFKVSAGSRNKQRLQLSNALAAARTLKPKGNQGKDTTETTHPQPSPQAMSESSTQKKIAISKSSYRRPKHDRVYCKQCAQHPEGFRGEHELRRHEDRQHKSTVKKWICIQLSQDFPANLKPLIPLQKCKACRTKKKYGAYYNAAAHLRRAHFTPKFAKSRAAKTSIINGTHKREGIGGVDWPPMQVLKMYWMLEVEESAHNNYFATEQTQMTEEAAEDEVLELDDEIVPGELSSMTTYESFVGSIPYAYTAAMEYSTSTLRPEPSTHDFPRQFPDQTSILYGTIDCRLGESFCDYQSSFTTDSNDQQASPDHSSYHLNDISLQTDCHETFHVTKNHGNFF